MSNVHFTRALVKGKIAEIVFAQMLRETGKFTVLEFGYEHVIPELTRLNYNHNETIDVIRHAPDFAVINHTTKEVNLVEVRYQRALNVDFVLEKAKQMSGAWNPSFLFVATQRGFYCDQVDTIVANQGQISMFLHPSLPPDLQSKYLRLLVDFEKDN